MKKKKKRRKEDEQSEKRSKPNLPPVKRANLKFSSCLLRHYLCELSSVRPIKAPPLSFSLSVEQSDRADLDLAQIWIFATAGGTNNSRLCVLSLSLVALLHSTRLRNKFVWSARNSNELLARLYVCVCARVCIYAPTHSCRRCRLRTKRLRAHRNDNNRRTIAVVPQWIKGRTIKRAPARYIAVLLLVQIQLTS